MDIEALERWLRNSFEVAATVTAVCEWCSRPQFLERDLGKLQRTADLPKFVSRVHGCW